jgi:hypothetical protein
MYASNGQCAAIGFLFTGDFMLQAFAFINASINISFLAGKGSYPPG